MIQVIFNYFCENKLLLCYNMNNLYVYLLLGIFLYLLFTRVLESYIGYNLAQENFDPSLVPVSSIVTLAKVAQKLVNGNGIFTNPGNLQIGATTSSPGNLTVTGNSIVNGNSTVTGTLDVTGATTLSSLNTTGNTSVGGTLGVTGGTTIAGLLTANGGISTTTITADSIRANSLSTTRENIPLIINGIINLYPDGNGGLYFLKSGMEYNTLYTGETTATTLAVKNPAFASTYKFIPDIPYSSALNLNVYNNAGAKQIANFMDNGNTNFLNDVKINGKLQVSGKKWRSTTYLEFEAKWPAKTLDQQEFIPDTPGYRLFMITLISKNWNRGGNQRSSYGQLYIKHEDNEIITITANDGDPPKTAHSHVFYRKDDTTKFYMGLRHTAGDPILCHGEWEITGIM